MFGAVSRSGLPCPLLNQKCVLASPRHHERQRGRWFSDVCNLYSLTKSQDAIRRITGAMRDTTGNLPPLPGIFPDYATPIVRSAENGERELLLARWGMASPLIQGK